MEASANLSGTSPRSEPVATPVRLSLRMLRAHQICDDFSGKIICLMLVLGPWAFGSTQLWAIWTLNGLSFLVASFFGAKLLIRRSTGYFPARWGGSASGMPRENAGRTRLLNRILAWATVLLLAYCLASVLNARSTYHREIVSFEYFHFSPWLPNSHDRASSIQAFFNYLAMALAFWALRDWLLGKSPNEERAERGRLNELRVAHSSVLPDRLCQLLWVLSVSGGLLALEGMVQRLSGTPNLLFVLPTYNNQAAEDQFGPYAYRSNAAQYFNLLWPVCLGFWWTLQRPASSHSASLVPAKSVRRKKNLILGSAILMAACPVISTTRVGALVAILQIVLASLVLLAASRRGIRRKGRKELVIFIAASLALAAFFGWGKLAPRFGSDDFHKGLNDRNNIYNMARPMARDYPVFGTGPGTFESVFQLYRIDPDEFWPAQLHNDWLETRITFGCAGQVLILTAFFCVLSRWFIPTGIPSRPYFVMLIWLALAGCLFHARYDFPFQVYSVIFLFFVLCAVLFSISDRISSSSPA